MNTSKKAIKPLQEDPKKETSQEKISAFISQRYQQRQYIKEREQKVMLDRFLSSTNGKSVVLLNRH